jgi:DNA invertase Pin-like site-specific DNA recombinase
MKRAVIYAAKSTVDERGSIPDQLADGRKLAAERALAVASDREFWDEDKSAFHGNRGDGLVNAMAACERLTAEDGSCALIVQRSDRLARGDGREARSLVEIVLWAIKHDVELFSVMDPEILAGGDLALVMGAIGHMKGHGESKVKSESVKKGMRRRAERGEWVGGRPPYGLAAAGRYEPPVVVEHEAEIVRSVFRDYAGGRGQRAIVRRLNDAGVPAPSGRLWHQSQVARMLANPAYIGKVLAKGDDGKRSLVFDGKHEAIVDDELWQRVQAIRNGAQRRPGRHADGTHLLVRGALRCSCGAAMLPRKARPGIERERYVCSGRIADPCSCSQRSIRRELIDEPLLATLLDTYIDLDATRERIDERASAALTAAREALEHAQRETAKSEAALARVERDYLDGKLAVEKWERFEAKLTAELEAAQAGEQRAQGHVQKIELAGVGDAEGALLDLLARLKRAVGEGTGEAPDLHALRNTIGQLFASVDLVRNDDGSYLLLPALRVERLDAMRWDYEAAGRRQALPVGGAETLSPTGQATPSPPEQSYPPTFFARYCWW